ncbi:MAG: hypothetical protein ACPF9D_13535, partial [Owenweeksia sp.]
MKRLILVLAGLMVVLAGCEDPTKDINLHIAPSFYKYVVEVELQDLGDPDELFSGDARVKVTGP